MQQRIVYAGVASRSFAQASTLLERLADLTVNAKQVERLTRGVGQDRVAERQAVVAAFEALPLVEKFAAPPVVTAPPLAVVMVDGGRLQILDRSAASDDRVAPDSDAGPATADAAANASAPASGFDDEPPPARGHWREDKIGLLLTMTSAVSTEDPYPEVPAAFVDRVHIPELVGQWKTHLRPEQTAEDDGPPASGALGEAAVYRPPKVAGRQVVASRSRWPTFAPQVAQAAWAAGFQRAERKAFVADGSANNWVLQRRFFGSFVPILDFIHALSYVYAASTAGRSFAAGWACYREWITWVWQGRVGEVITALAARQAELGEADPEASPLSPAAVVGQTLGYLRNHREKMKYPEYRRAGLPLTSSLMESAVKQINQRVKGSEKFWSEDGSEAVLQLRADQLSDGEILERYWERRQATATGQRRYRRAA